MEFSQNTISISANNPDLGEAVEEIEADYKGKAMSIGFNARYLIDVLGGSWAAIARSILSSKTN